MFEWNPTGNAIVNAGTVSGGVKAGDMRSSDATKPCTNEFTGGVFAGTGLTLYVNQQHNANPTFVTTLTAVVPPADVPEAPVPVLLALSAAAILGGATIMRRRQSAAASA